MLSIQITAADQQLEVLEDKSLPGSCCTLNVNRRDETVAIAVPPSVNVITRIDNQGDSMSITTEYPHGLFIQQGDQFVLGPMRIDMRLAPMDVSCHSLNLRYKDARRFTIVQAPRNVIERLRPISSFVFAVSGYTVETLTATIADRLPSDISLTVDKTSVYMRDQCSWSPAALSGGLLRILPLSASQISPGRACVCVKQTDFCTAINLRLGTYTPPSLCRAVSNALNSIHITSTETLTFEDPTKNSCICININKGSYTLSTMAEYLQQELEQQKCAIKIECCAASPFHVNNCGLVLSSAYPFGVKFGDCNISDQFGYQQTNLRACSTYKPNIRGGATLCALCANKMIVLSCTDDDTCVDAAVVAPPPIDVHLESYADGVAALKTEENHTFAENDVVRIGLNVYLVHKVGIKMVHVRSHVQPTGATITYASQAVSVIIGKLGDAVKNNDTMDLMQIVTPTSSSHKKEVRVDDNVQSIHQSM